MTKYEKICKIECKNKCKGKGFFGCVSCKRSSDWCGKMVEKYFKI